MTTIKLRRGTSAEWTASNPVLADGEPGFEKDTGQYKLGNGVSTWSQLPYFQSVDKLSATFARRRFESVNTRAAGAIVFSWDDGFPEWAQMIDLATSLGQRHTLAVTSDRIDVPTGITSATILAAAQAGHEIAAHSKTHAKINSTLLTPAQRLTEYETPRTVLEGIIGTGKVRSWVYPYGTASSPAGRDATTDQEVYLRYDRQLDTVGSNGGVLPMGGPPRFTVPRINFDTNSAAATERVKELIRRAASAPIIVPLYSHDFPTPQRWANVQAVMQLAHDLGVPCLSFAEAFPASPFSLPDPSFEGSEITWFTAADTVGTFAHVAVTPDVNIAGSKALSITATDMTHAPNAYMDWQAQEGTSYTVSGRVRSDIVQAGTAPAMKVYVRAEFYKYDGSSAGAAVDSAALNGTTWQRFSHTVTTPAGTETMRVKLVQLACQGTTYFDHVHLGPTAQGSFG